MEQYLALTRQNQAPGVVKPKIRGDVNFEIKSQFMRILNIVSLFNIPGVTHDEVMLRVSLSQSLELRRDGWKDYHQEQSTPGIFSSRLSFKDIVNHLKRQNSLRKSTTSSKKGPIPNKTLGEALEAIQNMADHSQKWHDGSNSRKVSSGSSDGIAVISNKLNSLGRDMKKLKENVLDPFIDSQTMSSSTSTHQQSLADAGSKTCPPLLKRGLYVMKMIQPDLNHDPRPQTEDDLTRDDLKQYEATIKAMKLILIFVPNDIYNFVDACENARDMWDRVKRLMQGTELSEIDREP
ncbi:hypothetical protein Tco_0267215 [Tanacetum coccineum]